MVPTEQGTSLDLRLTPEHKRIIEEAAARVGLTLDDFAVSTLVHGARRIIDDENVTRLSRRDQERLMAILDDESSEPNAALVEAAKRYKEQFG